MPRARRSQRRPNVAFVVSTGGQHDRTQVRAHAAYWSHARRQKSQQDPQDAASSKEEEAPVSSTLEVESAARRRSPLSQRFAVPYDFLLGTEFDVFATLPRLPMEIDNPDMFSFQKVFMFKIFGEEFIYNDVLKRSKAIHTVFAACLLVSIAYYVAKSGNGQRSNFALLKGEVIKRVQSEISNAGGNLSLELAHAVSLLGCPLVNLTCNLELVSDQAKQDVGAKPATRTEDARRIEEEAYQNTLVHQRAADTILSRWPGTVEPAYQRIWWQLATCRATAHGMHVLTLPNPKLIDFAGYREWQVYGVWNSTSDLSNWFSPLTQKLGITSPKLPIEDVFERQAFRLAAMIQIWLDTCVSSDAYDEEVKTHREELREDIQRILHTFPVEDDPSHTVCMYTVTKMTIELMLHAEEKGVSLFVAGQELGFMAKAVPVVRKTFLGRLWDHTAGMLYWIAIVLHMAPGTEDLRVTSSMLLTHFTQTFTASELIRKRGLDVALEPMRRIVAFDEACRAKPSDLSYTINYFID